MTSTSAHWFAPVPAAISAARLSLHFELRAADLFFRELVVPELGRVWFVRQLSWPLAALALHEDMADGGARGLRPTAICHGIEALACKLEYSASPEDRSPRILGSRAFGRDADRAVWSFLRLRQRVHYVRNTHRQSATRALRVDGGLGFARGSRFDLLELEPVGRELANAFLDQRVGRGGASLRTWLGGWLAGDRDIPDAPRTLRSALSPDSPTEVECALVRSRLRDVSTAAATKRRRLAEAVGLAAGLPDIEQVVVARLRARGHDAQADEVLAARAFGAVLDRCRDALAALSCAVEPARSGMPIETLAVDKEIRRAVKDLRAASRGFMERADRAGVREPTSRDFANGLSAADDAGAIRLVVRRAGAVLQRVDGAVVRGPLFRVLDDAEATDELEDGAASIEPDRTGRTFRIANLHALLRDIHGSGAR